MRKNNIKTTKGATNMKKKVIIAGLFILCTASAYTFGKSQNKAVETIPDNYINTESNAFLNDYVDMKKVADFETTENGLYIYTDNGDGYYWER